MRHIAVVIVAMLFTSVPASAQPWVFLNFPGGNPPGGKSPDPLVRCRTALRLAAVLHRPIDSVFGACPMLADATQWEDEPGSLQPYIEWEAFRKERLDDLFQRLLDNRSTLGLSCPNPNVALRSGRVYLTEDQAFDIYAAHVANAVYLEATRRVPWSILTVPHEELRILLASPSYFVRLFGSLPDAPPYIDPARAFTLPARVLFGDGLVCDPRVGYGFLSGATSTGGENLIGATEEETLARIGVWMARDVVHGLAEDLTLEHERQYTYLEDRLRRHAYSSSSAAIMAGGCQSAASFIHDLAKSINIPLLAVLAYETPQKLWPPGTALEHQGLLFHWARKDIRVLWHADDFYSATLLAPYFPIDAGGRPLSTASARRLFFDVNFVAPDVLTARDFEWFGGVTTFPEAPTMSPPRPFFFSEPVIGTWNPPAVARIGDVWDKYFDLCTWNNFVQFGSGASFYVTQEFTLHGPWPLPHPLESFGPRADACAAAYGGLDALAARSRAYEMSRGSNLYGFVPVLILPPWRR